MTTKPAHNSPVPPPCLSRHREMIGVATLALILAFSLEVRPDERVAIRGLSDYPLPHTCASRAWFRLDCPGCGLTRSMIHLAHGHWTAATRVHRLGPLLATALLLQFPYRLYCLRRRELEPFGRLFPYLFGNVLIIALIGNWLYGLRPTSPTSRSEAGPVMESLHSPVDALRSLQGRGRSLRSEPMSPSPDSR
jgi:hypothetical protein